MHARRDGGAGGQVQHVAVSEQRFRAALIENRARVHLRGHLKRNTRRNVRLDEARDHVHGRTLRGQDQVNAGGTRLLRQSRDQLLHLLADDHHQIRELVDNDHDEGQAGQVLDVLRHDAGHPLRDLLHANRILDRLACIGSLLDLAVETADVAHAEQRHQLIAPLHLRNAPAQRIGRLFHVGDHRREQMRNALVHRQFEHLRIDHDHAHVFGHRLVQQAQDHGVDAHRLARSGRACDQKVRHARQIRGHRTAADVLAERQCQGR